MGSGGEVPPHKVVNSLCEPEYVLGLPRLVLQDQVPPTQYDARVMFLGKSPGLSQAVT